MAPTHGGTSGAGGGEGGGETFRARALARLIEGLGEPARVAVEGGVLYRWRLQRPHGMDVYVMLNSPELPDLAHIVVSDPSVAARGGVEPVSAMTLRTMPEVEAVVGRILAQWRGVPPGAS